MEYNFNLIVDSEQKLTWVGEEEPAMVIFYSEIRKLDCAYRIAELSMKATNGGPQHVRAVAHSDGRRV